MRRRLFVTAIGALALVASSTIATGPVRALHEDGHPLGIAAWEIDGVGVDGRENALENGSITPLPTVQRGDRVTYLVRIVDQADDATIQLSFNSPGHAYVLGSAPGGSCEAPAEVAPGMFQHDCVIAVGDGGSGDLSVTYEITASSDNGCDSPAGEPDVVTLIVTEPVRAASDVVVCGGFAAPAPSASATPAPALPDTAVTADAAEAARPNAIIGIGAVLLLLGSLVLLPRRR
ncbi:MAG: hypothetical protein ABR593_09060 [Candidatus Limnocylindria bacterium]